MSVPPAASVIVGYYSTIHRTILITNDSRERVLVEEIALRLQSDREQASIIVAQQGAWELGPGELLERVVSITPTPIYLANTNMFDVKVRLRVHNGGHFGHSQYEVHPSRSYILIEEPRTHIGKVFISIKQPEDEPLGRLMETMARRAGFVPFLKASNPRPGQDIWRDVIEPTLLASDAVIVIWTEKTEWGTGVQKEVRLCHDHALRHVLLLQEGQPVPALYADTSREYERFDPHNPGPRFAEVLSALREEILSHRP